MAPIFYELCGLRRSAFPSTKVRADEPLKMTQKETSILARRIRLLRSTFSAEMDQPRLREDIPSPKGTRIDQSIDHPSIRPPGLMQ